MGWFGRMLKKPASLLSAKVEAKVGEFKSPLNLDLSLFSFARYGIWDAICNNSSTPITRMAYGCINNLLAQLAAGSAESGAPFHVKGVLDTVNASLEFGQRGLDRLMRDPPHRIERCRIAGQAWDDVPVDVRELVAEEFVVDLLGGIGL